MNNCTITAIQSAFQQYSAYILAATLSIMLLSACSVTKPSGYFTTLQKDTTLTNFETANYESKIIKGDKLGIVAGSNSPSEDALFNGASGTSVSNPVAGYTVQQDGTVKLHRIGRIKAEGLTRKELAKQIEDKLQDFMKEPLVQVTYLNHKITIMGEVAKPQVLNLPEEQISLIDALVLSGDVRATANINKVTVIREEGNMKKVKILNLQDNSLFSSPWYYVKPNDIILVGTDYDKIVKTEKRQKLQSNISLVVSAASLLIIILDRVIK